MPRTREGGEHERGIIPLLLGGFGGGASPKKSFEFVGVLCAF